ncbi:MAG TPA: serine--tRNA ligase, partial [Alcanivorax sp.]|nr:serine--tRNA ligase [Alcanivorax sp.]
MLDIRALRQDGDAIREALKKRGYDLDLAGFESLDARRKEADMRSQDLQAQRKKASKEVGELIKSGMDVDAAKAKVAETLKTLDAELDQEVARAKAVQEEIREFLMGVPNVPVDEVPAGNDEDDNVEVRQWGTPTELSFTAKDHVDLGEAFSQG